MKKIDEGQYPAIVSTKKQYEEYVPTSCKGLQRYKSYHANEESA